MIKNAIISFILFFIAYNILFKMTDSPGNINQNQSKGNIIKAEDYMYEEKDITNKSVIIGSSLANRMKQENLPDDLINLGLSGQSLFDGLNIILSKTDKPHYVLIETNVVMRGENSSFKSDVFNPIFFRLKNIFETLRIKNQPIGLLERKSEFYLLKVIKPRKRTKENKDKNLEDTYERMISLQEKKYVNPPDESEFLKLLQQLKNDINELEKQGVCVVFFEMPVSSELCDMPLSVAVREGFYKEFPPSSYQYIPQPDCADFKTRDGLHLVEASADKYTEYLMKELQNIECK